SSRQALSVEKEQLRSVPREGRMAPWAYWIPLSRHVGKRPDVDFGRGAARVRLLVGDPLAIRRDDRLADYRGRPLQQQTKSALTLGRRSRRRRRLHVERRDSDFLPARGT